MERSTTENYGKTEETIEQPSTAAAANTLGGMVVNLVLFEGIFGGLGTATGLTAFGEPSAFAHTLTELTAVNNIASMGFEEEKVV